MSCITCRETFLWSSSLKFCSLFNFSTSMPPKTPSPISSRTQRRVRTKALWRHVWGGAGGTVGSKIIKDAWNGTHPNLNHAFILFCLYFFPHMSLVMECIFLETQGHFKMTFWRIHPEEVENIFVNCFACRLVLKGKAVDRLRNQGEVGLKEVKWEDQSIWIWHDVCAKLGKPWQAANREVNMDFPSLSQQLRGVKKR